MFTTFLLAAHLLIGDAILTVEVADTPFLHHRGLMGRNEIPSNHGMLFVYEKPSLLSFWMKDTLIPLSIGFFDENNVLLKIEEMAPLPAKTAALPLYKSPSPAQYALEVPRDWFRDHNITPGMKFTLKDLEN